jgi:hypothetical protein
MSDQHMSAAERRGLILGVDVAFCWNCDAPTSRRNQLVVFRHCSTRRGGAAASEAAAPLRPQRGIQADSDSVDCFLMDERRLRPRRPRHGRRLSDGTVIVTSPDDDGQITHAIRYDESMKHVLEELEGEAAEAAYGSRGSDEIDSPACGEQTR